MAILEPADRVEKRVVTVPDGTLEAAPQETDISFDPGMVVAISIIIPAGHAGLTGLALMQAGQQVLPRTGWIIANDAHLEWTLDPAAFINNGDWQARAYNTDVFDHAFHLTFLVAENEEGASAAREIALPLPL